MANRVHVVKAECSHVKSLEGRLREEDEREAQAAIGMTATEGMRIAYGFSRAVWAAEADSGEVIAIFGCAATSMFSLTGIPWMVGTDKVSEYSVSFARGGRRYVSRMLLLFDHLDNYVDVRNSLAIKWLKWIGFTLEPAESYGYAGLPFHRFHMTGGK